MNLTFKHHINEISKSSLYKLRNLKIIRNHFNQKNFEILIHAFITAKIDYCNSLFSGISKSDLRPLEVVQNFAAKLVLKRSKFESSRPLLKKLHWLPISRRIDYKLLLITYKARNSLTPDYISALMSAPNINSFYSLRSAEDLTLLDVYLSHSKRMRDRGFSIYAPKMWNLIPREIRESPSVQIFKSRLKTFLYKTEFFPPKV